MGECLRRLDGPTVPDDVRDRIATIEVDSDREQSYDATVVVVTFDRDRDVLERTLESLNEQVAPSYEVVLLDNGTDWNPDTLYAAYESITVYVEFEDNYGVNVARNLGASLANGDVLIFLDDDAEPAPAFVSAHLRAHEVFDVVGARGRIFPHSTGLYGRLGPRYDLGDSPFPYPLDTEGNLSIDREAFFEVGGFDEELYGHEGLELTSRLIDRFGTDATIYYPDAVVYHDFVDGFTGLVAKKARHKYWRHQLKQTRPEVLAVDGQYDVSPPAGSSMVRTLVLYLLGRMSDLFATLLFRLRSYEDPTR